MNADHHKNRDEKRYMTNKSKAHKACRHLRQACAYHDDIMHDICRYSSRARGFDDIYTGSRKKTPEVPPDDMIWKKLLLPLEFPLISRICLLGLLGFSGQVCAYKGLELGSTTLASAISNLAPAFTFILAVLFRYIYPEEITVNVYYNMSVAIIALAACLIKEQNLSSWTLHPSISVVSVLYSGLFGFPFSSGVHKWGLRVKGPVFVAIFRPTSIVIAVIMSAIFLGEAVYLGSVIGGVILTIGLYSVLWGKAKEEMKDDGSGLSTKDPLLKSQNVEEN
ncbi:WAT1-related protein At5g40240-like [Gossypium arboreum]|uniref:WAT1-related protein At5g40240-like n=1 Tax=Gossypium arboreum TaxID=29729 RepID=UPI0022F1D55B|nr:WAT1-related protein At5g40240-like [Gossypium arboreum]